MLTEICEYLNNWFDMDEYHNKLPHATGKIHIENGHYADLPFVAKKGQFFYIHGSVFNDGVHQYTDELKLIDEIFDGLVQSMIIPPHIEALAGEIKTWQEKYGSVASQNMSPFNSESFGGYSYSKGGGSGSDSSPAANWQNVYAKRLNPYRRLRRD